MPDIINGRDCTIYFRGDSQTVAVHPDLVTSGWPGGVGVQWCDAQEDVRMVQASHGLYGGFLVWGSNEDADRYLSSSGQMPHLRYATLFVGGSLMHTSTYERFTWASRQVGLSAPLEYKINDPLYFSLRGYWTNEDEMTLSGHSEAPCFFTGFVSQLPKESNQWRLGIQTSL
jgi:hypothetical protein